MIVHERQEGFYLYGIGSKNMTKIQSRQNSTLFQWTRFARAWFLVSIAYFLCLRETSAFLAMKFPYTVLKNRLYPSKLLAAAAEYEDELKQTLKKAHSLLEKSRAKLATAVESPKKELEGSARVVDEKPTIPFFASTVVKEAPKSDKRGSVVKWKDEVTGLITTDGDMMAALSEEEEWETRPLLEIFQYEVQEMEDVYSLASKQLAERDVAASIFDLRKSLQNEDYRAIFDKKNRFIGEDN